MIIKRMLPQTISHCLRQSLNTQLDLDLSLVSCGSATGCLNQAAELNVPQNKKVLLSFMM